MTEGLRCNANDQGSLDNIDSLAWLCLCTCVQSPKRVKVSDSEGICQQGHSGLRFQHVSYSENLWTFLLQSIHMDLIISLRVLQSALKTGITAKFHLQLRFSISTLQNFMTHELPPGTEGCVHPTLHPHYILNQIRHSRILDKYYVSWGCHNLNPLKCVWTGVSRLIPGFSGLVFMFKPELELIVMSNPMTYLRVQVWSSTWKSIQIRNEPPPPF